MLLFTSNPIGPLPPSDLRDLPFQPGEIYIVRYMTVPTVVTIEARTANDVQVVWGRLSVEEFNGRVLFRLGRRSRLLGMWMPWAVCDPRRVIDRALSESLGTDQAFWRGTESPDSPATFRSRAQ